jgi:glycosyltransferase involved in cell wall biosynthesis
LGLSAVTEFSGHLPYALVPAYLNQLDIYVAASRLDSESFGVAILEASACGLPVVVSRVGGLVEVVEEGVTGYIVDKEDVAQFAAILLTLVQNPKLRDSMGMAGRQTVKEKYDWQDSLSIMEMVYQQTVSD